MEPVHPQRADRGAARQHAPGIVLLAVQQLTGEGGFALLTGAPGCGKSAALRILTASLATQRDVTVGVISRPQANIADFYREIGELFGV